jgi:hypothetical protein
MPKAIHRTKKKREFTFMNLEEKGVLIKHTLNMLNLC